MPNSISCVIPVFNGERFLVDALDSVFAQTLQPAEVIVVDDGSTDDTAGVAARYAEKVTYLRQDNVGAAGARNRGIAEARCEFIAFLDADDVWLPEKLALQAARFAARPHLEVSITHIRNFWEPELRLEEEAMRGHVLAKAALPGYTFQTMLAHRSTFDRLGVLNPDLRITDDVDWFIRAKDEKIEMELMPDVLVHRRLHRDNLTRRVPQPVFHSGLVDAVHRSLERRRQKPMT